MFDFTSLHAIRRANGCNPIIERCFSKFKNPQYKELSYPLDKVRQTTINIIIFEGILAMFEIVRTTFKILKVVNDCTII